MNGNDWTTVPGWDPAKQEYVGLDCERWIKKNKIREAGRENGEQEFPPSEAAQPDAVYTKIVAWVNQRGKACHAEVRRHLVQQRFSLELETKEGMAPIRDRVAGIRDRGIVALADHAQEDRTSLQQKEREAREASAALDSFKATANLKRVAEDNERGKWYWLLLIVIAGEALVNALFLADVHQSGLLGAVMTMLGIGVVNVAILGAIIGEGWRQKNSVRPWIGWMMVLVGALCMIFVNLFVGHFRDNMLAVAAKAALGASSLAELLADDTINRFLNNPIGLEHPDSWLLTVIGAGCCVFGASKWYKRDDPYPGYGDVSRAATERFEEYRNDLTERRANLQRIYEEYTEKILDEKRKIENTKGNHRLITDTAREIVRQFPMHLRLYQDHLDFIIAAYRSANEKARSTPSPRFFAQRLLIDPEMLEAPEWVEIPAPVYDEDWEDFRQAEEAVRKAYVDAQAEYPALDDMVYPGHTED